ncbi:hypothetical protein V1514DRAFT_328210 [Lipomyces japonicus]|uniref:uncharacterized protein n=1 Tax=Lipomyces japonicus TaxID=56871 RepID=UPI0034CD03EA
MASIFARLNLTPLFESSTYGSEYIKQLSSVTISQSAFNEWLFQDYIFVRAFAQFLAATIASVPENETNLSFLTTALKGGFGVLEQELAIFEQKARQRGVEIPKLPKFSGSYNEELEINGADIIAELKSTIPRFSKVNELYCSFLAIELGAQASVPFHTRLAVLWAAEVVYLTAFKYSLNTSTFQAKADASLKDFLEWWGGNTVFDEYVGTLGKAVEIVLDNHPESVDDVTAGVKRVLDLEVGFWNGALEKA